MKKILVLTTTLLVAICGVFIAFSPDTLSMVVVGVMLAVMAIGHVFGILPNFLFCDGFRNGRESVENIHKIAADNKWAAVRKTQPFFKQKTLDGFFETYLDKAQKQQDNGLLIGDIEDVINEDSLELRNWRGVVLQVAGVLTALGLLGTFLGLMTGINSVTFSTVDATITSIERLLGGIATAFYTSIVGVILSVVFNIANRIVWNITLREMNMFMEVFHAEIQPLSEEQMRAYDYMQNEEKLRLLSQINYAENRYNDTLAKDASYEQRLMVQVLAGVELGEFSTMFEPVCKLEDRSVVKVVSRLHWEHQNLGVIHPSVYYPALAANGYLLKLEQKVWHDAAENMSSLKKSGQRTVPIVLNASKVFVMASDPVAYIDALIDEFDLTPRDFEVSISLDAYTACHLEAVRTEQAFLKKGYKVSIFGFGSDVIGFPETNAEEIVLDMEKAEPERVRDVFSLSLKKNLIVSVSNIASAKQLAELRKLGCEFGMGRHLYPEMKFEEFAGLIDGETV